MARKKNVNAKVIKTPETGTPKASAPEPVKNTAPVSAKGGIAPVVVGLVNFLDDINALQLKIGEISSSPTVAVLGDISKDMETLRSRVFEKLGVEVKPMPSLRAEIKVIASIVNESINKK